jgi:hypothetical protein
MLVAILLAAIMGSSACVRPAVRARAALPADVQRLAAEFDRAKALLMRIDCGKRNPMSLPETITGSGRGLD